MKSGSLLICFILVIRTSEAIPTYPSGCGVSEEIDSIYLYSCNYGSMANPLTYSGFSDPIPQRLRIYNINGALTSSKFSGFSSFDMTTVSSDHPTSLILQCTVGGTLTFDSTTFADFGYVQELQILGCTTSLGASTFSGFAVLNKLLIQGGTMSSVDAGAFTGLSVEPVANYPVPLGLLSLQKLTLSSALPTTVFSGLTSARWIYLDNLGLSSIDAAMFSSNKAIRGISLRDNTLTTLPENLFDGLDGLSELDQSNIAWDCSCSSLAFLRKMRKKNIRVIGAPVCASGENADNYYNTSCVSSSVCGDTPGIVVGGNCIFIGMLIGLIVIAIGLILSIVALALVIHVRKTVIASNPKRKKAPPPPGSNPKNIGNKERRGSGWV